MTNDYTEQELRQGAERLYDLAWKHEEPQYRPNSKRWVKNAIAGIVSGLSTRKQIDLLCENQRLRLSLLAQCTIPSYSSSYPCWCDPMLGRSEPHVPKCLQARAVVMR